MEPITLEDLKKSSREELYALSEDLRQVIISTCLKNGGHLGASLGAVELAIALHFVFESPREPLVWDVGHQAYAHKLLTGRSESFHTLRQQGGLSGFLSRDESVHDAFGAGHSSTALSAALGMAYARQNTQDWTVAIMGDGGITAGVALEAINNARSHQTGPLLLVLNDNQMSISQNVGRLAQISAAGRTREFFELFDFDYVGPVDGHNLTTLISTLQSVRASRNGRPVVLHVLTQKGKGYGPAEESPASFHGISPLVEKTPGATIAPKRSSYSEVFGRTLVRLAESDPKIVAITAAMPEGTGLSEFAARFPGRFFDVGIAEPHAVTFAASLATQGFKPVVAIYSTFLQRGLDGVIHDVALQKLGVTFAVDRAGLVGADGPTHHGMFDLAYFGMVPNMTISAPACLEDLASELEAALGSGSPWAIRYPRGSGQAALDVAADADGMRWHQRPGLPRVVAIALGSATTRLVAAAQLVDPQGEQIAVSSLVRAKPLSPALCAGLKVYSTARLLTVEDGVVRGGLGECLISTLTAMPGARMATSEAIGYPDAFITHGNPNALDELAGVSTAALAARLRRLLEEAD